MRYTGEDGRRDAEDGAIVRLAGEITAPGSMCDILGLLGQAGWRGELVVQDAAASRSVFFEQGNVVGVTTSVDEERIGSVLYKFGVIDLQQRERTLQLLGVGKRFGEVAIEQGILTREQLYKYMLRQIEEVVFAMLTIGDGTFFFLEGFDETRLATRHYVSANALLMDAVTRMDELKFFEQKIPSREHVPVRNEGRSAPSEDFAAVYAVVDGKRSIEEIGRLTGLGEFETTKRIYSLIQSHHVGIHPPRLTGGPTALVSTANGALRAIFHAAEAGNKTRDVRESLASFATGAGVYEILFRNAGPDETGALDPDRVAENSVTVAGGADPLLVLKQMLHEYVSFALFSAGAALGANAESELVRQLGPALTSLLPQG
jgi:hypothetical protein